MNWKSWLVRSALVGVVLIPAAAWASGLGAGAGGCCPLCALVGR